MSKQYDYRDENGNPLDYYTIVNDATQMLKEIEEKDKEIGRLNKIIDELEKDLDRQINFCSNEAETTINNKYCIIALKYLKSLKNKLKELKGNDENGI